MTTFTTEVQIDGKSLQIERTAQFLTIGSCFADHIAGFLSDHKFSVVSNPLGIVYNPLSLCQIFDQILEPGKVVPLDSLMIQHDGLWHSLMHHGQFSRESKKALKDGLDAACQQVAHFIKDISFLFITLGSGHAYRYRQTGDIVANCHKIPAAQFEKILLTADQIIAELEKRVLALKDVNKKLEIILTVSPVRYIRDGLVENSRSKANLLTAVHDLVDRFAFCHYFPAYELVIDELRDYRFYKVDMVHPSDQAIAFVLDKFTQKHFTQAAQDQVNLIAKFRRSLLHRPLHLGSDAYKLFRKRLIGEVNDLAKRYGDLDFEKEISELQRET